MDARTISRLVLWAGTIACVGSSAVAAEPSQAPLFVEKVQVNLVSVDVWVTGPDGHPMPGLGPGDFQVFEDGAPVAITNFFVPVRLAPPEPDELAARAASLPPPPASLLDGDRTTLVLLLDNASVTTASRNQVLERTNEAIEELLKGGRASVMVATASPTVRIRQRLTANPRELETALISVADEVASENGYVLSQGLGTHIGGEAGTMPVFGGSGAASPGTRPGQALQDQQSAREEADVLEMYNQAQAEAQQIFERARGFVASLEHLLDSLSGASGRKVLFYVGNGLPVDPGGATFSEWDARFGRSNAGRRLSAGLEQQQYSLGPLLRELVGRANAGRVTLCAIDTSGNRRVASRSAESSRSTADSGSLVGADEGRNAFLRTLAGGTGGRVLANSSELSSALSETIDDLGAGYSLAYVPDHQGDGKLHVIKVKVARAGTRVRHRDSYVDKSADDLGRDRTLAALYLGDTPNPLAVTLSLGSEVKQPNDTYVVPVMVNVPLGNLMLLPKGEIHVGSVSAWLAVSDDEGHATTPTRQTFTFRVPNQQLLTALSQNVSYPVQFLMKPGKKRVAASVRDDSSLSTSSTVLEFTVPHATEEDGGARE